MAIDPNTSISGGAPIECYALETPSEVKRYTSYHSPIFLGGHWYFPEQISRSAIEVTSNTSSQTTVDVKLPSDHEVSLMFAYGVSPKYLYVTIYLTNEGNDYDTEFSVEWSGSYIGSNTSGAITTFKTASIVQADLAKDVAPVEYQNTCNHALYDDMCGIDKAVHSTTSTVTKVIGQEITVASDGFPNSALNIGQIVNTRNNESQIIVTNVDNLITVMTRFIDIKVGDTVEMSRGCDHARLGNCKGVFNNVARYGGFDFIPVNNPFISKKV